MNRPDEFSIAANNAADRYRIFLETLLGTYNRSITSREFNSKAIGSFVKQTNNMNKLFLEREVENTIKLFDSLKEAVANDTKAQKGNVLEDEAWSDYAADNATFLFEAIKLQSSKDVLYINQFYRTKVLEVNNLNDWQKAYNLLFDSKDLSFYYTDKIGRKINSVKYIRTINRDFLVKSYNDLLLGSAIINGLKEVSVNNTDEGHKDNNKIISVNDKNTVNYFTVRNDLFHPNSNSFLRL